VTGAELKQRIVRIMSHRAVHCLGPGRKLLLVMATIAAVAGPIAFGLMSAPQETAKLDSPKFEVASIKPVKALDNHVDITTAPNGRFTARNVTVKMLITEAYQVKGFQITGEPKWVNSERYDIVAKADESATKNGSEYTDDQLRQYQSKHRLRLQALLADRFQLKLHKNLKELPVYALILAKNGSRLQPVIEQRPISSRGMHATDGRLTAQDVPLSFLTELLSDRLARIVLDRTGLKGDYDFTLNWTPEEHTPLPFGAGPMAQNALPQPEANGPSIFTALQEQLGLKLEPQKGPVEILVIDHVEKPTPN
jgi:uncharacterized protein (TIGR03435 family)